MTPNLKKNNYKRKSAIIFMATFNGSRFIEEQLDSLQSQTHKHWKLIVRDDHSEDDTLAILKRYQKLWGKDRLVITKGKHLGFCQNFLTLAQFKGFKGDYFAFCDHDDVWLPHKLEVAITTLEKHASKKPLLYCGRTTYVDQDLNVIGISPLFKKPPLFQNAIVQSIAGGNTMVFNIHTKKLLEDMGLKKVISHDWWTYLLVTGVGGRVIYDPRPYILYRQHDQGVVGANNSFYAQMLRLKGLLKGRFKLWNTMHVDALTSSHLKLTPQNQLIIGRFLFYRRGNTFERLKMVKMNGLYRQSWQGNISLYLAALFNLI